METTNSVATKCDKVWQCLMKFDCIRQNFTEFDKFWPNSTVLVWQNLTKSKVWQNLTKLKKFIRIWQNSTTSVRQNLTSMAIIIWKEVLQSITKFEKIRRGWTKSVRQNLKKFCKDRRRLTKCDEFEKFLQIWTKSDKIR